MSNVIPFPTSDQHRQEQVSLDALRDDYGDPEPTRVRRENLRLVGGTPNPAPTLFPEAMGRVRDDLRAGRFNRQRHAIHQAEDALHESGFPDGAA